MLINGKHLLLSLEWGFCRVVDWESLGGRGRRSAFAVHRNIVCNNLFTNIICFV